ncbi:fungal-specific transcription factor domain-containing protein [Aspergillus ambiguus]|uniref:transcription factor domain-containing protein n=1 Tax=Aspergillus ambiguus TaxID=176160 RepID=UPI003CCDBB80
MDSSSSPQASPSASDMRPRKMRKVTRACDACKFKKKACTGTLPCGPCVRKKADCTYNTTYHRGVAVSPPPSFPQQNNTPSSITESTPQVNPTEDPLPSRASADVADQYWGPTSAHSFLGRAVCDLPTNPSNVTTNREDRSRISKTSIFLYGDRVAPEVQPEDFRWPDRAVADSLIRRYFEFAAPTYRILHQPTVEATVHRLYQGGIQDEGGTAIATEPLSSTASRAIVLLAFSTATMFQADAEGRMRDADEAGWRVSELYYSQADQMLSHETGAPCLESAQARFLMVLYLVSSSRAHKAWFTLGTVIQLIMALGFHSRRPRRDSGGVDLIQRECQRRILWCSYTLDKYLSVILGRPRLWHDEDLDEDLPARVNDQEITPTAMQPSKRDCMMDAPVFHALLARILAQAAKEPYVVSGISSRAEINTIQALCASVAQWQAELPPFLSGIIHPSSLIPSFQRQLTVLQLARYHVLMFITRPLLLRNYGQIWPDCEPSYLQYLSICLTAARDAIELILTFVRENQLFHAFWYSQYIAFNALSIIYIYLIQVQRGRIVSVGHNYPSTNSESPLDEAMLYRLSETAQYHLADATIRNAPSWKYSAILQGLRRELERLGLEDHSGGAPHAQADSNGVGLDQERQAPSHPGYRGLRDLEAVGAENPLTEPTGPSYHFVGTPRPNESYLADPRTESLFDLFAMDKDLMLDFWPQLDTLPITYL